MIKRLAQGLALVLGLAALAALGWWATRGPSPEEILAAIEPTASPVLSPAEEQATFRLAPGFRVELVAAEPLVVDPVAMDWDDQGRLYVVEMRGFMPTVDGTGEDAPRGRVVILEDTDADGRMDRSEVLLDGLVLPRAVAVLPDGVLIGGQGDLLWCARADAARACDAPQRLGPYAVGRDDPEHLENALLQHVDGWVYNAKSERRFRLEGGRLRVEATVFRGQWGLAQDDAGRLFYNHNSTFLQADLVPGEVPMRHPMTATAPVRPGIGQAITPSDEVYGVRAQPGLNRAYIAGTLRPDGRQQAPTGVSGLEIQRGHQYGPDYVGDAFVPEAAGNAVAHFDVVRDGLDWRVDHRLYDDAEWGKREFLASDHERFRPVDAKVGPDGAVWLIDMYRGVIQHKNYLSDHARDYALAQGLEAPGATGRIWRIVREGEPIDYAPPPLGTTAERIAALDHANGWVRDRAQRALVRALDAEARAQLRKLERFGPLGRRHALWVLAQRGELDDATWRRALADPDPELRAIALRAGARLLRGSADAPSADARGPAAAVLARTADDDPMVRIAALAALANLPADERPLPRLLDEVASGDAFAQQAALSALAGLEARALEHVLARDEPALARVSLLAGTQLLAAREASDAVAAVAALLDRVARVPPGPVRDALLAGMGDVLGRPTVGAFELAAPHALFAERDDAPLTPALRALRRRFTWPGDPTPGGARALTSVERERRERGAALYAATCATCHGSHGAGQAGLAPPLVGSPWVRHSDDWLVRIVLAGMTGPLAIDGEMWDATMPPHGADPRFDDDTLAGLATHLRRSWGHADRPVAPETVARIRADTRDRALPWTVAELLALEAPHRYDGYVGVYRVPIVGLELEIARVGTELAIGMKGGGKAPLVDAGGGSFAGEVSVQFDEDADGRVVGVTATRDGTSFPLERSDS